MKICTQKNEIPTELHFAALAFSQIHIPGDERSQTHPGHGYPEETRRVVEYIAFASKEEMENWAEQQEIKRVHMSGRPFVILKVSPCAVETSVSVKVTPGI